MKNLWGEKGKTIELGTTIRNKKRATIKPSDSKGENDGRETYKSLSRKVKKRGFTYKKKR